uniref:Helicase n=1 Tax=Crocidura lasiura hepevirus TaxID=3139466 RepID=A0AB38ZJR1_9VIRU
MEQYSEKLRNKLSNATALACVANAIKNAHNVPYAMTKEQNETLNNYYSPKEVIATNEAESAHPISSSMLHIANTSAATFRTRADVIEVGGDIKRYNKSTKAHLCLLNDGTSIRDDARLTDYYIHARRQTEKKHPDPIFQEFVNQYEEPPRCTRTRLCMRGMQNCQQRANEAIAVFSAFDISFQDWYHFMDNTGVARVTIWGYYPPELLSPGMQNLHTDYVLTYYDHALTPTQDPDKIRYAAFNFTDDASTGYVHNYRTWRSYLTTLVYQGTKFNIDVEKVASNGPALTIILRRSRAGGLKTQRDIRPYNDVVCVPDVLHALRTSEVDMSRIFIADRGHVEAIINYAVSLPPNAFNHTTIATYAKSRKMALKIGVINVRSHWKDRNCLDELVTRLIIIAMLRRTVQSKKISEASQTIRDMSSLWGAGVEVEYNDKLDRSKQQIIGTFLGYLSQIDRVLLNLAGEALKMFTYLHFGSEFPIGQIVSFRKVTQTDAVERAYSNLNKIEVFDMPSHITTMRYTPALQPNALRWFTTESCADDKPLTKPRTRFTGGMLKADYLPTLSEDHFGEITRENINKVHDNDTFEELDIELVVGYAGTGKSRDLQYTDFENSVVIIPLNALREDWKYFNYVYTQHQAFQLCRKFERMIVDECFMLHPAHVLMLVKHFNIKKLVLVGDPFQIEFIDFTGKNPNPTQLSTVLTTLNVKFDFRKQSLRFGDEYARNIARKFGLDMTGNPERQTTYTYVDNITNFEPTGQLIVFTQKTKLDYSVHRPITAHEAQGKTFNRVDILILEQDAVIARSARHQYVALTRAKTHTTVWDATKNTIFDLTSPVENSMEIFGFSPFCQTLIKKQQQASYQEDAVPWSRIDDCTAVDDVLSKIVVPQSEVLSTFTEAIPENTEAMTLYDLKAEGEIEERLCMKGARYAHDTYVKNSSIALYTLTKRYGKRTENLSNQEKVHEAASLAAGFIDAYFVEGDITQIDEEDLNEAEFDNYAKMLMKGTETKVTSELDVASTWAVEFFLKQQSKAKTKPRDEYDSAQLSGMFSGKAGQGVSAWSKTANAMLGPMFRAVEKCMRRNFRDNVILANGMQELKMLSSLSFQDLEALSVIEGDIEEFDCNQNECTVLAEAMLYAALGVPAVFILLYVALRKKRTLLAKTIAKMVVLDKQDSGQPATLTGNTTVALMIISRVVDNIKHAIVLGKGDDTLILGTDICFNDYLSTQDEQLKLKIKAIQGKPPQFINFFITPNGAVPDVVRLAAKVKSKTFRTMNDQFRDRYYLRHVERISTAAHTLDYSRITRGEFESLDQVMVDPGEHIYITNVASPSRAYYALCFFLHRSTGKKIITHVQRKEYQAVFTEFARSVHDRLAMVSTAEQYSDALSAAANYYTINREEAELCWNWLKSITPEHLNNNTEKLTLAHYQIETDQEDDAAYAHVPTAHVDLGGDGDCFWRVMDRALLDNRITAGMMAILRENLPDRWVEYNTALDLFSQNKHPFAFLIDYRASKTVQGNLKAPLLPYINLTISDGTTEVDGSQAGHYTYIPKNGPTEKVIYIQTSTYTATGGTSSRGTSEDVHDTAGSVKHEHGGTTGAGPDPVQKHAVRSRRVILQQLQDYASEGFFRLASEPVSKPIHDRNLVDARSDVDGTEKRHGNREPSYGGGEIGHEVQVQPLCVEILPAASFIPNDLLDWIWRRYRHGHPSTAAINFVCGCNWANKRPAQLWSCLCNAHRGLVKSWRAQPGRSEKIDGNASGWLCSWCMVRVDQSIYIGANLDDVQSVLNVAGIGEDWVRVPDVREHKNYPRKSDPEITRLEWLDLSVQLKDSPTRFDRGKPQFQNGSMGRGRREVGGQIPSGGDGLHRTE